MLANLLGIRPGVTAVIGSGGKTSLLRTLGAELAAKGLRVILTTTTKIYPFPDLPNLLSPTETAVVQALSRDNLLCVGTLQTDSGKLTAPELSLAALSTLADYVLVEADGAAGRPLKAHAPWEPVIPPEAGRVICVAGLSGLGKPIREAAHRPEYFASLIRKSPDALASWEDTTRVLEVESLADIYFFNQADTPEARARVRKAAKDFPFPAAAGSLREGVWEKC